MAIVNRTSPGLVDTHTGFPRVLESGWTDVAEMAVTSSLIIEHLDIVEHISTRSVTGFIDLLANPFLL